MQSKKRFLFVLLTAFLLFCLASASAEGGIVRALPFPGKNIGPESFCIAQDGSLMALQGDTRYVLSQDKWVKTDLAAQPSLYTVSHENLIDWTVQKGETLLYDDNGAFFFHTLYPVDDQFAYGTQSNKVYRLDMTTGERTLLCNIDGFSASDWADGILVSGQTVYVMQTQLPMLQAIDLEALAEQGFQLLTIAVASSMDIGNTVLDSTEQRFAQQYPQTIVELVKMTADQCRLNLMSDPSSYDLIVAQPDLWDDLAEAGIFEDLESHPSLQKAWSSWISMDSLCRYRGTLCGVLLWEEAHMLSVNEALVSVLSDVTWPDADWTWRDFLDLARQCCRDLNGDGRPDLYITYQRMFYPAWNDIYAYSLPVHQAALLHRHGVVADLQCDEILDMLQVWKTCWDEGLLCPEDGGYENPHNALVVFAENLPTEWCQYRGMADIRLTMPGLTSALHCVPAESVLMSLNTHSAHKEQAVEFLASYMSLGADEHNYLRTHAYSSEKVAYDPAWEAPDAFREAHYIAAMENLYRDDWDMSLYDDMEQQLTRYLNNQISAEECARLWQEKLRMTRME
ncbi:MAG: hypothetical protein Q4G52_05215 [Clostridia bacterium]|nr:hypothetical protein [Clostridia bacterium]